MYHQIMPIMDEHIAKFSKQDQTRPNVFYHPINVEDLKFLIYLKSRRCRQIFFPYRLIVVHREALTRVTRSKTMIGFRLNYMCIQILISNRIYQCNSLYPLQHHTTSLIKSFDFSLLFIGLSIYSIIVFTFIGNYFSLRNCKLQCIPSKLMFKSSTTAL